MQGLEIRSQVLPVLRKADKAERDTGGIEETVMSVKLAYQQLLGTYQQLLGAYQQLVGLLLQLPRQVN